MVKVKICGITREEDLKAAVDAGADSVGFVVDVPSSPRNLSFSRARDLIANAPKSVSKVAVTVFKDVEKLKQIRTELDTDYLQLHGNLQPSLQSIGEFSSKKRIIGAVNAKAADALDLAVEYSGTFNAILLDTGGEGGMGGTGIPHDWRLSAGIRETIHPTPLILAGGLTAENVSEAIRCVKPYGVDVSSGVEKKPGIKDHDKIFKFIAEAKEEKM